MATTVTLQTIVDLLGVSWTTVSNAFSRPDQLSDELRARVLAAAAELDYRGPNPAARTLRRGRAGAIGVVLTDSLEWAFADPYNVEFLGALAGEAEAARHSLLLIPAPPGQDQAEGVRSAVVDGFCVYTLHDGHPIVGEVLCRNVPTVFVDGPKVDGHRLHRHPRSSGDARTHRAGAQPRSSCARCARLPVAARRSLRHTQQTAHRHRRFPRHSRTIGGSVRRRPNGRSGRAVVDVYEVVANTPAAGREAAIALLDGRSSARLRCCASPINSRSAPSRPSTPSACAYPTTCRLPGSTTSLQLPTPA